MKLHSCQILQVRHYLRIKQPFHQLIPECYAPYWQYDGKALVLYCRLILYLTVIYCN